MTQTPEQPGAWQSLWASQEMKEGRAAPAGGSWEAERPLGTEAGWPPLKGDPCNVNGASDNDVIQKHGKLLS